MSVQGDHTELYCEPSDVARFIKPRDHSSDPSAAPPTGFDAETTPTYEEVVLHIEGASQRIDRKTQNSWRAKSVSNETHDHKGLYYWLSGHPIDLLKKNIRPLDATAGDSLEIWNGNQWENWLNDDTKTPGRDGDYWIDAPNGLLWIYERAILRPHPKFRISYRYGYDHVPHDIREAVAKRAAADIITGDFYGTIVPGNNQGDNADPATFAEIWRDDFKEVCRDYKKISFV